MIDEIKRVAARIAKKEHLACSDSNYLDSCELYLDIHEALATERRKAYEECAQIAERCEAGNGDIAEEIANEIRRRMEGL